MCAGEAARLTPASDDKPKIAEINPFFWGSDLSALLKEKNQSDMFSKRTAVPADI